MLSIEAKSVKCSTGSQSDLIKLSRYMKDTLDTITLQGFNPVCLVGALVSGDSVSLYLMEHSYDYLYILYKAYTFNVPVNSSDMFRIIPIIPIVKSLRKLIQCTTDELARLRHNRTCSTKLKSKKTFHSPVKTNQVKRPHMDEERRQKARRKFTFD